MLSALVSLLVVARAQPQLQLATARIRLAFSDAFGIGDNHYAALWDRIGAHSPRVTELDPYPPRTCFATLLHCPGPASASMLTALPVHRFAGCASAVTWAGAHYLRHLYGYAPPSLAGSLAGVQQGTESGSERRVGRGRRKRRKSRVVRVLFLSRSKLDRWFFRTRQYSHWRGTRHIYNEPELLDALGEGLRGMCEGKRCRFERIDDEPGAWVSELPDVEPDSTSGLGVDGGTEARRAQHDDVVVRLAVLDPLLVPLDTQVAYLARTDVVVGSHGGALALSLFMPPGSGAMVELQVDEVFERNFHFKNLCYALGRRYRELLVDNTVEAGPVVDAVREMVEAVLDE